MNQGEESHEAAWRQAASRAAWKINLAWWLHALGSPLMILGILGAGGLLAIRRQVGPDAQVTLWATTGAAVVVAAGIAYLLARRRFESPERSLVRLEAAMQLRNALSTAKAGVAAWPEFPGRTDLGLRWNWQRVAIPPVAALALLIAGLLIPVSAVPDGTRKAPNQPLAWEEIEADLERLEEDELLEEDYFEETRKKLDELRDNDERDWFSHSSLEATDALKQQHQSEIRQLSEELEKANRALGTLQQHGSQLSPARKDQVLNQFDQALQGLQEGALKPNSELMDQLSRLDPSQLGQLDPQQLEELRQNLQKAGEACKECQGGGAGQGGEWLDELLDGNGEGQSPGQGNGQDGPPGDGPGGKGGVNRGPGHAPGVLGDGSDPLAPNAIETLKARDLSRATPGDLLQLQAGEHDIDEQATRDRSGGTVQSRGQGGDRIWQEALDPAEQRAVKRYFE